MSETWESTYSGFDHTYGWTQWVLREARMRLPEPKPSPACVKSGHKWGKAWSFFPRDCYVQGCERCAKRGLVVLRTVAEPLEQR